MRVEGNFSSVDVYQCFRYTPFDSYNIPLLLSTTTNLFLEVLMFSFLFCHNKNKCFLYLALVVLKYDRLGAVQMKRRLQKLQFLLSTL